MSSSISLQQHASLLSSGLARLSDFADAASARISSGNRLYRPAADPADVGRAASLDSTQARLRAVEVNIQNGTSRLQSTTGQLSIIERVVTRFSELSALSANAVQTDSESAQYATEFRALQDQLRQIIGGTTAEIGGTTDITSPSGSFNDQDLFGAGPAPSMVIGTANDDTLTLPTLNFRTAPLADLIRQDASGQFTQSFPPDDIEALNATLKAATDAIATAQAQVGAGLSRLDFASGVATTAAANHEAALSTLRDADIAADTTAIARLQFLTESHTSMLAQAREATSKLLPLLSRN